jgi:hypothetical protein
MPLTKTTTIKKSRINVSQKTKNLEAVTYAPPCPVLNLLILGDIWGVEAGVSDGVTLAAGRGEESSGIPRCLRKAESARIAVQLGREGVREE